MIFDKLCGIAERHENSLVRLLREAKLFVFDKPAHEFLPKDYEPEKIRWLEENFVLPFPVTAVEDPASCILLMDVGAEAHGLNEFREFVECLPVHARWDAFREGNAPDPRVVSSIPEDAMIVSTGRIEMRVEQHETVRYQIKGEVLECFCAGKSCIYDRLPTSDKRITVPTLRNTCAALEEMMFLNSPDRFILEASPVKSRASRGEGSKIPRSHDRPTYTLLKPMEIRRVMRSEPDESAEKRISPIPHERRAHTRVLRRERYKAARGKTVIIPAVWVGVSEAKVGNKLYRVRLDL